jgi:hypothetical protein
MHEFGGKGEGLEKQCMAIDKFYVLEELTEN